MFARAGKALEILVLVLGLGAGLTMAWASLQLLGRGEVVGRQALDQAEVELSDLVRREWDLFVAAPAIWDVAGVRGDFDFAEFARVKADGTDEPADFPDRDLFDVLLREARRLENAGASVAEIRSTLDSAEALGPDASGRAVLGLRRLQLALAAGEDAAPAWDAALEAARAEPVVRGVEAETPAIWLAALAMASRLDADERRRVGEELGAWVVTGKLLFPSEVAATEPELPLATTVRLGSFETSMGVDLDAARESLLRARALRRLLAEGAQLDAVTARVVVGLADDERLLVAERRGERLFTLVAPGEALMADFRARLDRTPSFGGGFFAQPAGLALGEPDAKLLGEPIELGDSELSVTLAHEDPSAFIRSEGRRQDTLRFALLVMGIMTLVASSLAYGALVRQRRLGQLKTEFIAKVSHELRTPITGILLASEGLEEGKRPSPERRERYLGLIRREAKRLERLVANVLDFSRLDRGAERWLVLEPVAIGDLVDSLVAATGERLESESGVELRLDVAEGLGGEGDSIEVSVDGEALWRAVSNLVENALLHGKAKRVTLSARIEADELVLAIEDDGAGVAARDREAVFEAFAQVGIGSRGSSTPHTGAGLGLSIVREIVRGHGGEVHLRRAATGAFARFELRLPRSRKTGSGAAS